jgi:hypothetical protein
VVKILLLLLLFTFQYAFAHDAVQLSQDLLYQVRIEEDFAVNLKKIAEYDEDSLLENLNTESKKMAFWLNIYNAFIQIKAKEFPNLISEKRNSFFSKKFITIAHKNLSFDDIEHGILRHSKMKISLGYVDKIGWFVNDFEKKFRMDEVDFRIHFALNCGAASCPPIAFYSAENINNELHVATVSYLETSVEYNKSENNAVVSKLFQWFIADFGGKSGILNILKRYGIIPKNENPKIKYKPYDWTISLENYIE